MAEHNCFRHMEHVRPPCWKMLMISSFKRFSRNFAAGYRVVMTSYCHHFAVYAVIRAVNIRNNEVNLSSFWPVMHLKLCCLEFLSDLLGDSWGPQFFFLLKSCSEREQKAFILFTWCIFCLDRRVQFLLSSILSIDQKPSDKFRAQETTLNLYQMLLA